VSIRYADQSGKTIVPLWNIPPVRMDVYSRESSNREYFFGIPTCGTLSLDEAYLGCQVNKKNNLPTDSPEHQKKIYSKTGPTASAE
jgi:hypothetical protein